MTLFQALLIGLFAYLGSKRTPWFFGVTGGWNMIGRPLVAGLIVGIILGDVTNGVIAGAMVQAYSSDRSHLAALCRRTLTGRLTLVSR